MGKQGKKDQAGKPKKLTPKDVGKRLDALVKKLGEELEDADLFAPLPPTEDCAICFVPLSRVKSETYYQTCCGNEICLACYKENKESINKQNEKKISGKKLAFICPFCREPEPTPWGPEHVRQLQARCLQNDYIAPALMGESYRGGTRNGRAIRKDDLKALDYFIRAVGLGSPEACTLIGGNYDEGSGVAVDKERAALFWKIGALRGCVVGRYSIGLSEYYDLGNHEVGIRHWKIAADAGNQNSLNALRDIYNASDKGPGREFVTKEYLNFAFRACHEAQMEVKSEAREKHRTGKNTKVKAPS